jgi:hypothetical protein
VKAEEARIEHTDAGAAAASLGWFVVNLAEARWMRSKEGGEWTDVEPPDGFEEYGIGVHVLPPGAHQRCVQARPRIADAVLRAHRLPPHRSGAWGGC